MTRFPLRAKLALVALALLVLPWAGWRYVREMERFLLAAQEEALMATARAVATALHERPKLLAYRSRSESELRSEAERELQRLTGGVIGREEPRNQDADSEITAILKGLERASSRIWVVSRDYHVLALAGSLKRKDPAPPSLAERTLGWLLAPPTEEFDDAIAEDAIAAGREVAGALQGAAGTRTRNTRDGQDFMRHGVAADHQPRPATRLVIPQVARHAGGVGPQVQHVFPRLDRGIGRRAVQIVL